MLQPPSAVRGEFNAADQVRRGLKPDADFSREGFVERVLYSRALLRRQVKRTAHERGGGPCLKGLGEARFRFAVHLSQAASKHLAQAFFRLVVARSINALRAIAKTSCWVRRRTA